MWAVSSKAELFSCRVVEHDGVRLVRGDADLGLKGTENVRQSKAEILDGAGSCLSCSVHRRARISAEGINASQARKIHRSV